MLVLATLFWGLSFPLMKHWQLAARECPGGELVASHTLMGLRMVLALLVFAVFRPGLFAWPTRREWGLGAALGLLNFVGQTMQMLGLTRTTPALSGFLTSLASAWVPLLAFVWFRTAVARPVLWGLLLGLAGAAVLGIDPGQEWMIGGGEALTLLSTIIYAVLILLLDRWGRTVQSAHLTIAYVLLTGLPAVFLSTTLSGAGSGLMPWLSWLGQVLANPRVLLDVVLLAVFCTVCASLWMSTYQPRLPASRAALIYFLEPVFAATFSVAFGLDHITLALLSGGGLILLGNLLVELPVWLRQGPVNPPHYEGCGNRTSAPPVSSE